MIKNICNKIYQWKKWKFVFNVAPEVKSFILIGAPHTSNIDFFTAMYMSFQMGKKGFNSRFVIKKEWMKFPFNLIMSPLGGYGLDRSKARDSNMTEVMASLFTLEKNFVLMISPEGTRKAQDTWKTGFYYIAAKAGVPIALGFADYQKKTCGVGKMIYPKDFESDMREIMEFYQAEWGRIPKNFLPDKRYIAKSL